MPTSSRPQRQKSRSGSHGFRRPQQSNRNRPNHGRSRGGNGGGGRSNRGPAVRAVDPARYTNTATILAEAPAYLPTHRFADFDFDPRLQHAIAAKGYVTPTPIQDQAMPHVLAGRDLVGLANTGTGKTAGFVLPIINGLLTGAAGARSKSPSALVVAPTRELAQQIDEEFRSFAAKLGLRSAVCVGGVRENSQLAALRRHPHVVVGTPGRLKDFVTNRHLDLSHCQTFVLDEADRMLDMGFIHDMRFLMQPLPQNVQALCFSATITKEVEGIVKTLLKDPVTVSLRTVETSQHIEQRVIKANTPAEKLAHLERLLSQPDAGKVLVFGETKHGVQRLSDRLSKSGVAAAAIHGNKNQNQRQKALAAFKADKVQVLVATDVAARGLDVPYVSHVVNYDIPKAYEDYIHRIGRTGRAGQGGQALTFVPA